MLRPGDRPRKDVSGSCSSLTSSKKAGERLSEPCPNRLFFRRRIINPARIDTRGLWTGGTARPRAHPPGRSSACCGQTVRDDTKAGWRQALGPEVWTLSPCAVTATVTGMSLTSNS